MTLPSRPAPTEKSPPSLRCHSSASSLSSLLCFFVLRNATGHNLCAFFTLRCLHDVNPDIGVGLDFTDTEIAAHQARPNNAPVHAHARRVYAGKKLQSAMRIWLCLLQFHAGKHLLSFLRLSAELVKPFSVTPLSLTLFVCSPVGRPSYSRHNGLFCAARSRA